MKTLFPSGMVVRSALRSVVLPEDVAPATTTETPYLIQVQRKSIIFSVALPDLIICVLFTLDGWRSLIETLTPISSSTTGALSAVILVLFGKCPCDMGEALSIIIPE